MRSSLSDYIKSAYKNQRKCIGLLAALLFLIIPVMLPGCQAKNTGDENARFESYTQELFCKEVSANTVNLHYTLKEPEKYGIEAAPVTFGTFEVEAEAVKASAENIREVFLGFG